METNLTKVREICNRIKDLQHGVKQADRTLTVFEQKRLSNLRFALNNIKEDGYIGGESGVSESFIDKSLLWLEQNFDRWFPSANSKIRHFNPPLGVVMLGGWFLTL
jgi:hypothetical protein